MWGRDDEGRGATKEEEDEDEGGEAERKGGGGERYLQCIIVKDKDKG